MGKVERVAYIFGSSPQTYFMVRLLVRVYKEVFLVCNEKKIPFYSNLVDSRFIKNRNEYLECAFGASESSEMDVFITSGRDLEDLRLRYNGFFEKRNVFPNDSNGLSVFSRKSSTYDLCGQLNIAVEEFWDIEDVLNNNSVDKILIAKCDVENTSSSFKGFKTRILYSPSELRDFLEIIPHDFRDKIIFQNFISSPEGSNVSYLGYYDSGVHRFGFCAKQTAQYPLGITAKIEEYDGPLNAKIQDDAKKLVGSVGYTGFCEVEFKIDASGNSAFLIEVNPRPCGWSSLLLKKFNNLDELVSDSNSVPTAYLGSIRWINILRYLMFSKAKGFFCFAKAVMNIVMGKYNAYDVFNPKDIKPFFSQIFRF